MGNNYKNIISDKKKEARQLMTSEQLKACNKTIHTAAIAAGTSGAVPLPAVDALPISAVQITMVISLGKTFNQKLTESAAKGMISAAISTLVGRNIIKLIPVAGWIASAAVAAGITEALGWTVATDFAKASQNKDSSNLKADSSASTETDQTVEQESERQNEVNDEDPQDDEESIVNDFTKAFEMEE